MITFVIFVYIIIIFFFLKKASYLRSLFFLQNINTNNNKRQRERRKKYCVKIMNIYIFKKSIFREGNKSVQALFKIELNN